MLSEIQRKYGVRGELNFTSVSTMNKNENPGEGRPKGLPGGGKMA